MPENCAMDNDDCRSIIVREIKSDLAKQIKAELDEYFHNSPFMVAADQHYKDHEFVKTVRGDLTDVKRSFLSKIGVLLALAIVGGAGLKFLLAMIKEVWP